MIDRVLMIPRKLYLPERQGKFCIHSIMLSKVYVGQPEHAARLRAVDDGRALHTFTARLS